MSESIKIKCTNVSCGFTSVLGEINITDDHIRAIHDRMLSLGLTFTTDEQPVIHAPASPVDDEATIAGILRHGMWDGGITPQTLINAIRRGEVPGLTTTDQLAAAHAACNASAEGYRDTIKDTAFERDTLKAEVERLQAEVDYRREEYEKVIKSSQVMRDEMQTEVERLRAELARESDMWKELRKHTGQDPLTPEVERASAAVELIKRLRAELNREVVRHAGTKGALQNAESARDDAERIIENAWTLLTWGGKVVRCRDFLTQAESVVKMADDYKAERDAAIARAEKMEQAMNVQVCPDCGGDGHLGSCSSGKLQSCEYCGGHEDALGRGFLRYDPPERMEETEKHRDTARAAHAEAMELLRKMDAGLPYVARDPDVLKHLAKYGGGK